MKLLGKFVLITSAFFTLTTYAAMPPDVAQLCQQNKWDAALARVDVLLQANPGDAELTKYRAQIAAQVPAASAPAATGGIPDAQINKFNNYVAAGNNEEANKLVEALASFYPDDPRLPGLKAKLNASATSPSSSAKVAPPVVPAQPTGKDLVVYNAVMLLVQQAQQATDPDTRRETLNRILWELGLLIQKYPDMVQLWQIQTSVYLELSNDYPGVTSYGESGMRAAFHLLKLGAADSTNPALQQLMARLQLKGWLDTNNTLEFFRKQRESQVPWYVNDPLINKALDESAAGNK